MAGMLRSIMYLGMAMVASHPGQFGQMPPRPLLGLLAFGGVARQG
jgi:hypothetical protein